MSFMEELLTTQASHPLCIQTTLRIIGDRWTGKILRDLSNDINTFSALETSLEGISPRTLSQRLDMLEQEKIVIKKQYCERPPRYQYVLTPKGNELHDVIHKMAEWGGKYYSDKDKLDAEFNSCN